MFVYTLEFTNGWDGDSAHTVYDTEQSALNAAIENVVESLIGRGFDDPDCPETFELYEEIEKSIQSGDFRDALNKYNDIPVATQDDDNHVYLNIYTKEVCSYPTSSYRLGGSNKPTVAQSVKKEEFCCHCGRPNDVGISVCWYCGNSPTY